MPLLQYKPSCVEMLMSLINVKTTSTLVIDVNTPPFYIFIFNGNESACVGHHSLHLIKATSIAMGSNCGFQIFFVLLSFHCYQSKSVLWGVNERENSQFSIYYTQNIQEAHYIFFSRLIFTA